MLALAAGLLVLVLTTAACNAEIPAPSPTPTASPSPAGTLLTVETRGGLCPGGTCGMTIVVERDGRVHLAAKPPNDLGVVRADALSVLDEAIRTTDFAALRSHPFTGQCPTAFDGQEIIFEFGAPGGIERIATCEVEVDFSAPLFVAVTNAVVTFIALN